MIVPSKLAASTLLVACTFTVYWPTGEFAFLNYDDDVYTKNDHVRGGFGRACIRWAFSTNHSSNWHPLTWLSHTLDFELYGDDPAGHHLTNVGIHAANAVLLFLVLDAMTGCRGRSLLVALLFALHPLNVQSVAWVAERKNVLSTLFLLLTLMAYVRYARKPHLLSYISTLVLFVLGLMAKPMLVTLPFLMLLLDYWPLGRALPQFLGGERGEDEGKGLAKLPEKPYRSVGLRLVIEKMPFIFFSIASSAVTLWAQRVGGAVESTPLWLRLSNAAVSYWSYIRKMFWPDDLAVFYPYPRAVPAPWAILAGMSLLIVTALVVANGRRLPFLATGWLWYVGTLVPVVGVVQVGMQAMADRYAYVPLIGLFIMVSWSAGNIASRWRVSRQILGLAGLAITLALVMAARREVGFWHDSVTLFTRAIAVTHDNSVAHNNLGTALSEQNREQEAIEHFRKALGIDPDRVIPHRNLGISLAKQQEFDEAVVHFVQALRIQPGDPVGLNDLLAVLTVSGQLDEGRRRYPEAFNWQPDVVRATCDLAWTLATHEQACVRDGAEAVRLAERAVQLTGRQRADALDVLAAAYAESGRYDDATAAAQAAVELTSAAGQADLEAKIRTRLKLYVQGLPYREAKPE